MMKATTTQLVSNQVIPLLDEESWIGSSFQTFICSLSEATAATAEMEVGNDYNYKGANLQERLVYIPHHKCPKMWCNAID